VDDPATQRFTGFRMTVLRDNHRIQDLGFRI
jgi:hypothetical protein